MRYLFPLLLLFGFHLGFAQQMDWSKIDEPLINDLEADPNAKYAFYILLNDQVDVMSEKVRFDQTGVSLSDRTAQLLPALQEKARTTQAPLLQFLNNSDQVTLESIKPYWITNMIYVEGTQQLMATLSRRNDVAFLEAVLESSIIEYTESAVAAPAEVDGKERGLAAINAHKLWQMGYTGYGQVALILDTGTAYDHPALRNNYRGLYFDKTETYNGIGDDPSDCHGHGTHVAGTICGLNRMANDTIGVAFNAHWIAGPVNLYGGCPETVSPFDNFQWALDPDGNPATITDMPASINNSWGSNSSNCINNGGLANALNALEAVGVAVIWAAGNSGSSASTITTQGNINNGLVNSFSIGALNGNNGNFPIAGFSSRGPSTCGNMGSILIKPEVSAPGVDVRSAYPGGSYRFLSGTSMASPHVAGAITLLKEAFPELTGEQFKLALYFSAVDLGEPGEDNTYGMGMIDLLRAFNYLVDQGHTPVDPIKTTDALIVDFDAGSLNCNDNTAWSVIFENGGTAALTSLDINYRILYHNGQVEMEGTLNWTGNLDTGERGTVELPDLSGLEGIYDFEVSLLSPNGNTDERPLNDKLIKKNRGIFNPAPLELSIVGEELGNPCANTNAFLSLEVENVVDINWYVQAVGGLPIASGATYMTPALPAPYTFYADPIFETHGGVLEKTVDSELSNEQKGLVFDVYADLLLRSVKLYNETAGPQQIRINDANGNVVFNQVYNVATTGEFTAELNVDLQKGDAYEIRLVNSNGLYFDAMANFPYGIGNVMTIRNSTNGDDQYNYFYDWVIEHHHICGRKEVVIQFENTATPPNTAFTPSTTLVNLDNPDPVSFTNTTENAVEYWWNFGDGTTSNEENPIHEFFIPGSYEVSLTALNEAGCSETVSTIIEVEEMAVSTNNLEWKGQISVFPNPNKGSIEVQMELEGGEKVQLYLIDLLGQRMEERIFSGNNALQFSMDLQAYPNGMYHLVFDIEGRKVVKKIVKID